MMFYTFIKKENDGIVDVKRIGEDCSVPEEFQTKFKEYSENGYVSATAEEYDQQVIGAVNKQVEKLEDELEAQSEVVESEVEEAEKLPESDVAVE